MTLKQRSGMRESALRDTESLDRSKEWVCWVLRKEDIDLVARRAGLRPEKFKEEDYRRVALKFTEEFRKANRLWHVILEDAVERSVRVQWQGLAAWLLIFQVACPTLLALCL